MSDRLFQYPGHVEPVRSGPETVTVDRWQPTYALPVRRPVVRQAGLWVGVAEPSLFVTPTGGWDIADPAPTRRPAARLAGWFATGFDPTVTTPGGEGETVTLDKWHAPSVVPGRPRSRLPGQWSGVLEPSLFVAPPVGWDVPAAVPVRSGRRLPGGLFGPVYVETPAATVYLDWLTPQSAPSRRVVRPTGGLFAPVTTADPFDWLSAPADVTRRKPTQLSALTGPPQVGTPFDWLPTPLAAPVRPTRPAGLTTPVLEPSLTTVPPLGWLVPGDDTPVRRLVVRVGAGVYTGEPIATPISAGLVGGIWNVRDGGSLWRCPDGGTVWRVRDGGTEWRGRQMPDISGGTCTKSASDVRRFAFNFGDLKELNASTPETLTVAAGAITASPSGLTIGTATLEANGYRATATISGGTAGTDYTITCTVTLSGGGTIVRTGTLEVR